MWILRFTLLLAFVSMAPVVSQELNSTLHETFYGVPFAYDSENVIFTCVTRDSNSIAWSSDDYIGSGGLRLEFASVEREGTTRNANSIASAQLVSVSRTDGIVLLVSQLQISVQSTFQISSVTCHNIGKDTINITSFRMADDTSVTCDKPAVCPGETVTCTCTTGHSRTLAWSSDEFIGPGGARLEFASVQPVPTRQNISGSNAFAVLTNSSNMNGVVVLMSDFTFIVSENVTIIILTCMNVGRHSSSSIIVPMSRNCVADSTTTISTVTTDTMSTKLHAATINESSSNENMKSNTGVVAALVISCIITIIVAAASGVIILLLYCKKKAGKVHTIPVNFNCTALNPYPVEDVESLNGELSHSTKEESVIHAKATITDLEMEEPQLVSPTVMTTVSSEEQLMTVPVCACTRGLDEVHAPVQVCSLKKESTSKDIESDLPVKEMPVYACTRGLEPGLTWSPKKTSFTEKQTEVEEQHWLQPPIKETGMDSEERSIQCHVSVYGSEKARLMKEATCIQDTSTESDLEVKEHQFDQHIVCQNTFGDMKKETAVHSLSTRVYQIPLGDLEEKAHNMSTLEMEQQMQQLVEVVKLQEHRLQELGDKLEQKEQEMKSIAMEWQSTSTSLIEKEQQIDNLQKQGNEIMSTPQVGSGGVQCDSLVNQISVDQLQQKVASINKDYEDFVGDVEKMSTFQDGSGDDPMGLQGVVNHLLNELGNKDLKVANMNSGNKELLDDVVKQQKITYAYGWSKPGSEKSAQEDAKAKKGAKE